MDVGSPANGFEEITDLLKDDDSTLPGDLDLSFLLNKDIASDYVFDDLESENKFNFHFSEQGQQSEQLAMMSNFRYYDAPGPLFENVPSAARTGSSINVLVDTDADVLRNGEEFEFRSVEIDHNEDTEELYAGYLRDSASQVDFVSMNVDDSMDVCKHPQSLASMQDTNPEGEMRDMPFSPQNNGIEVGTFAERLSQEMNQSSREVKDDIPVQQIEKSELSPSLHRGDADSVSGNNDLRSTQDGIKELDSEPVDQHRTSPPAIQDPYPQTVSASQDALHPTIPSHDRACCLVDSIDPAMNQSLRSRHALGDLEKHVATPEINSPRLKRSISPNSSSRCKRICHSNSEVSSQSSRGWHKRSSERATCSHHSPESPNRRVSGEAHSRSQKHKHDLSPRSDRGREVTPRDHLSRKGLLDSDSPGASLILSKTSSSICAPSSTRSHSSQRSSHRKLERLDSASPVQRRHAGNRRERDISRSRSPHSRDRSRRPHRYSSRRISPARSSSSHYRSTESRYSSPDSYRRTGLGKPGTCLFVAGFAFSTTERDLKRKFSQFGRVKNVRVIRDRRSGISRGYGFLSLERDEEADAAIRALHRTDWNGRIVLVEKSVKCNSGARSWG